MLYRILTKNGVDNTNIDGARNYNFNAGRRSGIVKGALNQGNFFSSSSNTIALDTCELRLCGHRIVLDAIEYKTLLNIPSVPIRYSMIAQVIVDDNNDVSFDLIIQSSSTPLVQENLDTTGKGKFQLEIGRFTQLTDGTITDVVRTADLITGGISDYNGGAINIGNVTTNTLESGMEAEVDVNNRYDSTEKKTYTDFTFGIPKGQDGLNGIGINPNLLINGDFRVNQRGKTSYTTLGYTVDRWRTATEGTTVDVLDKGVRLNGTSSNNYNFYQFIEDYKSLAGKIITFSLKFTNNTDRIRLRINDGVGNTGSVYSTDTSGILTVTRTIADSPTQLRCIVQLETTGSSMSVDLIEAKLEIGSIATAFSPRPYAEELALCQRYYQDCRINISVLANTITNLYPNIPLIQTLRTNPTTTITTTPSLRGNGSGIGVFTISSITFNNLKDNSIQLLCTVDASTPVQSNYVYQLVNGKCTFDAEIY